MIRSNVKEIWFELLVGQNVIYVYKGG